MHDGIPEFQKASGHNVKPTFEAINRITEFVRRGDPADLAIVSPQQWESLQNEGKLDSTTRVVIAKVAYGVFVKKGAVKPDINSVEAFKRTFFNARRSRCSIRPQAGQQRFSGLASLTVSAWPPN